jgi:hypothetical protein
MAEAIVILVHREKQLGYLHQSIWWSRKARLQSENICTLQYGLPHGAGVARGGNRPNTLIFAFSSGAVTHVDG